MNESPRCHEDEPLTVHKTGNRFACVFYATNNFYAVAILVAVRRLKDLGISSDIDIVALHYKVSGYILSTLHKHGIKTISASPPAVASRRLFRDSLLKLRVLQLTQYERTVFLDADALPQTNLELLFDLKFNEMIAMPRAYWLSYLYGTSALLVARPSTEGWKRCLSWLSDVAASGRDTPADMEVLNSAFQSRVRYLPAEYLRLNGDWSVSKPVTGDEGLGAATTLVQVIHFTDLGKPWSYYPQMVRLLRPNAQKPYYEFWDTWWALRDTLLQIGAPGERFAYTLLKHQGILEGLPRPPLQRVLRNISGRTGQ